MIQMKQTHRHRKQFYGHQRAKWGRLNWEFGINGYTLLYVKEINIGPTASHRELHSSSCNACNGKKSEKRIFIYLNNHFAVHLKLTQHCKSTIFPIKKERKKKKKNKCGA